MNKAVLFTLFFLISVYGNLTAAIDWVGNRNPNSGTVVEGNDFNITVQVFKSGVTEPAGQGAGIACEIYYGEVPFFGGAWSNISSVAMNYTGDIGFNDIYMGALNLSAGLYEYQCRCTDDGGSSWEWNVESNGELTVDVPVPVTLTYLDAKLQKDGVSLDWETASELNNKHFEVERSTDSEKWELLDVVVGVGESTVRTNYSYTDADPFLGVNYYRLKQVDYDGSYEYSPIVSVRVVNEAISVFPNPVSNELFVELNQEASGRLLLYNQVGQIVRQFAFKQRYSASMDLSELVSGVYFLQVLDDNGLILDQQRVVKQ